MQRIINQLLARAGIDVNGSNPWDIKIHDERFFERVLKDHSIGLGETYMAGWWDCDRIDDFITRIIRANLQEQLSKNPKEYLLYLMHKFFNFQTKIKSREVAEKHYNIGNNLYQAMLGPTMNYSCGYWKNATTLDEAQRDKMELICRKLDLKPGMRVLDIGCGWGSFAQYAAEKHGVDVVGTTISIEQYQYAAEKCRHLPVKILLKDYRDLPLDIYDRVVSIGMFEHVGYKNYRAFMKIVSKRLADDGIFLLHTIGGNSSYVYADGWINKYIFPNGMLPSIVQIGKAIEGRFVMEDWHNFGIYYDRTLMEWHKNFNAHWPEFKSHYDERFKRMWNYYLLSCAGAFRARSTQLWQIVLTKHGLEKGFTASR